METLADRIVRDGPLNELDAVGWIIRLAKKLEPMHARGYAHGNVSTSAIKTANVSRTTTGALLPQTAAKNRLDLHSPERVAQGITSPADDTWAAAATLYELLTGTSPFAASDDDTTRQKIVAANPPPLASFDVGDDDLQHILDSALARDASARSSTIAGLRAALEGWHPDANVRDLPPLADDAPMEDDDEERTQMKPMAGAVAAMRAATAANAANARRDAGDKPPMRAPAQTVPQMPAVSASLAAATVPGAPLPKAHDLLEDDDDNAKTSLMRVPMVPMRKPAAAPAAPGAKAAPAVAPAPIGQAPASQRIGPAPISQRIGVAPASGRTPLAPPVAQPGAPIAPGARPAGGPAARALQAAKAGVPSTRTPLAPPVAQQAPTPLAPSNPGISREAVIDDGDEEATVMREAPIELLMQTSHGDGPAEADRATPVNPIPAEVVARASQAERITPPAPMPAAQAATNATNAFDITPKDPPIVPLAAARAPEPTMVLPQDDEPATLYMAPKDAAAIQLPPEPKIIPRQQNESLPDLFSATGDHRAEPAMNPNMAASMGPRPTPPPAVAAPLAPQPEPNATKGLLIGIIIALAILGTLGAVYFLVLKK